MNRKWVYIIVAAVVFIALAVGGAIYVYNASNYVAKVGNEKITNNEYTFFLKLTEYQFQNNLGITDWKTKIGNQTAQDAAKDTALEQAREFKIELMNARAKGIKLDKTDEDNINTYFDQIATTEGSRAKANEKIKSQLGLTLDQYKSIYRNITLSQKYKQQKVSEISVTDDETKKYYDDNKTSFDTVTVRHVLFSILDASGNPLPEDKQKEAEKKANDILAKVNAGEDIGALAKEYSEDPGSKDKNGEYTFGRGQMVKEFEDWSFGHNVGDTGVVKTSYGYHVMKLMNKTTTPLDDVKEQIKSTLKEQKYSKELEDLKKDPKYNIVKNQKVFESIKIA